MSKLKANMDVSKNDEPPSPFALPRPHSSRSEYVREKNFDARLNELGLTLPLLGATSGNYRHSVKDFDILYVAGKGIANVTGKVGREFTVDEGYQFARATGLLLLSVIKNELGTLNGVERIIRVFGMVNCTDDFSMHPKVIDGCSDLLEAVFGTAGQHVRMAVGATSLPYQTPVEIELSLRVAPKPSQTK